MYIPDIKAERNHEIDNTISILLFTAGLQIASSKVWHSRYIVRIRRAPALWEHATRNTGTFNFQQSRCVWSSAELMSASR